MTLTRTAISAAAVLASAALIATPASAATRWTTQSTTTELAATIHVVDGCLTEDASLWVSNTTFADYSQPGYPASSSVTVVDTCTLDASGQPTVKLSSYVNGHDVLTVNKRLTSASFSRSVSSTAETGAVAVNLDGVWSKTGRATTASTVNTAATPNTRTVATTVPSAATITVTAGAYTFSGTDTNATFKQTVVSTR